MDELRPMLPSTMNAPATEPQAIKLSHYTLHIVRWLGEGGGGTVYLAKQKGAHGFERLVVIKQAREGRPDYAQGLTREALILARLEHPNIIKAYDCEDRTLESGSVVPIILMEFGGSSLEAILRVGRPDIGLAMYVITKVLDALVYAHSRGVIHRDVKPGNVLIAPDGTVKVSDFGIAKSKELQAETTERAAGQGTLAYIAPEVLQGGKPDARSDVWAVCVMFYEILAGRRPWEPNEGKAKDWRSDLGARIIEEPAPPLDPNVTTQALADIIMRGLSKQPDERFATAAELLSVLLELRFVVPDERIALRELALLRQASESPLTRKGFGGQVVRSATKTVPLQAELREPAKMVSYNLPDGPQDSLFSDSSDLLPEVRTSDVVRRSDMHSSNSRYRSGGVRDTDPQYRSDTDPRHGSRDTDPQRSDTNVSDSRWQSRDDGDHSDTQYRSEPVQRGNHWKLIEQSDHDEPQPKSQERQHITERFDRLNLPPPKFGSTVQRQMAKRQTLYAGLGVALLGLVGAAVITLPRVLDGSTRASDVEDVAMPTSPEPSTADGASMAPVALPDASLNQEAVPRAPAPNPAPAPAPAPSSNAGGASDWSESPVPESKPAKSPRASVHVEIHPYGGYVSLDGRKAVASPATFSSLRVGRHSLKVGHSPTDLIREEKVQLNEGANSIRIELQLPSAPRRTPTPFDVP